MTDALSRRGFLQKAGVLGASLVYAGPARAAPSPNMPTPQLLTEIVRLKLRHTWTTTMSSSAFRDTVQVRYVRDGVTGIGAGAPIVRYKESADSAQRAILSLRDLLLSNDPWHFDKLLATVAKRIPSEHSAQAAIDIALFDWIGQRLGIPLYRYFGLDKKDAPISTMSIGIDTPEITIQKVREAEEFPVLKIKVGLSSDEATIAAVRSVTKKPLRVDANEGWRDKEEAVRKINWLESQGVELVEQPLPAAMLEETRWVRKHVHIPIIADEVLTNAATLPKLVEAFDGINVKLDKSGGLLEAYRWIATAKSLGLKTMLGCMVSSSVSITAAAHLAPLCDWVDLDGNLLIENDPYVGVTLQKGRLIFSDRPGLGLLPR